ncbi:MAG: YggW family oxidoreductase, partial [Psittacicella sp.]
LYELFQSGLSILEEAGYKRYEISAYGKSKDVRCLHNLNYWKFGDYLGIGCGAHGKLTLLDGSIYRTEKLSSPKSYMLGAYELKTLKVQKDEIIFQYFLNKFRLVNNRVYELELLNNTGFSFISIEKQIKSLNRKEFLLYNKEDGYIELTDKGFLFLNDVLEEFLN